MCKEALVLNEHWWGFIPSIRVVPIYVYLHVFMIHTKMYSKFNGVELDIAANEWQLVNMVLRDAGSEEVMMGTLASFVSAVRSILPILFHDIVKI